MRWSGRPRTMCAWYGSLEEGMRIEMSRKLIGVCCLLAAVGCTSTTSTGHAERSAGGRAFWSFMIPGVGQFTNGDYAKGALMMGLNMVNNSSFASIEDPDEAASRYNSYLALSLLIGGVSAADAHSTATELNRTQPLSGYRYRGAHGEATPGDAAPMTVMLDPVTRTAMASYCYRS